MIGNRGIPQLLRPLFLVAAMAFVPNVAAPVYGQCEPSTAVAKQKRTDMKHRKPASKGTQATATTVAEILDWDTPEDISDKEVKNSNAPIDELEDEVFEVEGKLWRVALEANDCDYHLELSGPGGDAKSLRIILEIPDDPGYATARKNLLEALEQSDREKLENSGNVVLQNPVRLKLRGYGFFDSFHYSAKFNPAKPGRCKFTKAQKLKRGNGHGTCSVGTLWELHPVWKLEALSNH